MGFWHIYMSLHGADGVEAPVIADGITTRLTLRGTSLHRLSVSGQSLKRITLIGSST